MQTFLGHVHPNSLYVPYTLGGVRRGVPVRSPDVIDPGDPIIAAVGVPGARQAIHSRIEALGLIEGRDFHCAA